MYCLGWFEDCSKLLRLKNERTDLGIEGLICHSGGLGLRQCLRWIT
jgi:hypothetical protein